MLYFIVPTLHRQTNLLKTENAENGLPLLLRSREKGKISRQNRIAFAISYNLLYVPKSAFPNKKNRKIPPENLTSRF